jgi:hypothetical protein
MFSSIIPIRTLALTIAADFFLCFERNSRYCICAICSGQPEQRQLFQVPLNESLFSIVTRCDYVLPGELPVFHIVVAGTAYRADFIKRYKKSTTLPPK